MWKTVKLGDVCDLQNGFAFKSSLFREKGLPILRISNIQNEEVSLEKLTYFVEKDYGISFERYKVLPNDLLIAMSGATTGKLGFNQSGRTLYLNQRVGKFEPKSGLDKKYLYYVLSTKVEENLSISKGAAQPNLSAQQIKDIKFPLPPLAEQQRIVAKLDAAFAEIHRFESVIKGKLSGFDALRLKTYQAIIKKHCSEQRQCKLSELVDESCSLSYGIVQPGDEFADGLPVVRPVDLKSKWIGEIDLKRVAHERAESYQRTKLSGGEVLLCVRGSTGVVSLASDELIGGNVTRGIIPIRFADVVNNEYGYYALQSEGAQKQITDKTYGATLQQINVKDVKNLVIDVPKIEEQLNAVAEIIKADDYLNELKSSTQRQLENAKQLKSAILAQELQPQEVA